MRPEAAHGAHDDGVVEEDVREQDRPHRGVQAQAPQLVQQPAPPDQRQERRADDDRRQHERHGHHGPQHLFAGELEAGEDVRAGQRDQQREGGGRQRLPGGEPQDVPHVGLREHVPDPPQPPGPVGLQAARDDGRDGVGEEHREERDRHGHQTEPRRAPAHVPRPSHRRLHRLLALPAHFSTSEVHDLTHGSRWPAIFAGSRVCGSSACGPNFANASGTCASLRTG